MICKTTSVCRPAALCPDRWQSPAFGISFEAMAGEAIYHICRRAEWAAAEAGGGYLGSSQDRADGFIHFSTASQVVASAAKHRAGQTGLVLLTVDPAPLGDALRWVEELPLGPDGRHVFPPFI